METGRCGVVGVIGKWCGWVYCGEIFVGGSFVLGGEMRAEVDKVVAVSSELGGR